MELAGSRPELPFLGVEVSRVRVEKAARRVVRAGLGNVFLVHAPAEYLLERVLPDACVVECWINFPDPWPKKRHHKRRLIRPDLVCQIVRVLVRGAPLHVATDHVEYADWIAGVLSSEGGLTNRNAPAPWSDRPPPRPETCYESEFRGEGRRIAYFEYQKRAGSP